MNDLFRLGEISRKIRSLIVAGDKSTCDAEQHYKAAGLYLIEARAKIKCTAGITWIEFLDTCGGLKKSRAYELISIASNIKSVAEIRTAGRIRAKRWREARVSKNITDPRLALIVRLIREASPSEFDLIETFVFHMYERTIVLNTAA